MYAVILSRSAQKGYDDLNEHRDRVNHLLDILSVVPRPFQEFDLIKLSGLNSAYRVRIGKLRIKYQIREAERVILVFYIGPREGAYD
ncbi:TPA: type II toxin-antitoxin system RelE/ParE family toxin [Candidatus Micrarchaeota archaeon]|nr:type II toxin-antitoxin system RelE/ParE family toxin [Candidatus Micrarchaeota archaeon]